MSRVLQLIIVIFIVAAIGNYLLFGMPMLSNILLSLAGLALVGLVVVWFLRRRRR